LIGAEVLIGIAPAFQISFYWVISEIVPMRWRYLANSYAYMITMPTNPLAAKIAFTFQKSPVKWRGNFYFMIGVNALGAMFFYLFYHPPTFKMLHRKKLPRDLLIKFDWVGLLLYTGSLLVFLLGLNWGGSLYPWHSGHVAGALTAGSVGLFIIFPLWEIYMPFQNIEPFVPLHLFTNVSYQCCCWLTGIGGCFNCRPYHLNVMLTCCPATGAGAYYGFSLIWPQAVASLHTLSYDQQGTLAGLAAMVRYQPA
jgi:hypothetical protein